MFSHALSRTGDALVEVGHPELVEETVRKNLSILEQVGAREFGEAQAQLGRAYKARKLYEHAIAAYEKASETTNDKYLKRRYVATVAELRRIVSTKGQ